MLHFLSADWRPSSDPKLTLKTSFGGSDPVFVRLIWDRGHCNVTGNEIADRLVIDKQAAREG